MNRRLEAAIAFVRRVRRKPPRYLLQRLLAEAHVETGRVRTRIRNRRFGERELLEATEAATIDELWERLASQAYPAWFGERDLDQICPNERSRIFAAADAARRRQVDMLGSGPIDLGAPVDWSLDYKTGRRWPRSYALRMQYNDPELPSDVKMPWEISRAHWLIPLGQAFCLGKDETYAAAAHQILDEWIADNPYARTVNWGVTMEAAMRIFTWSWLFHAFSKSSSWSDKSFRYRFLRMMYLHGEFTEEFIERSDINGNHYDADAAALVFAGLFFDRGVAPARWHERGWQWLSDELPKQVFSDGVDFEASIAYHRLVMELFLLPAALRRARGLEVSAPYRERLVAMARFVAAYCRPDGSSPLWGDADDARAQPLGGQRLDDHRYLVGATAVLFGDESLARASGGPHDEVYWRFGPEACRWLEARGSTRAPAESVAFRDGGVFVMRGPGDHVFIDCGPIGLGGRGGHGHNDCLSFDAMLDNVQLVTDCGAYLYTASYEERNRFRGTVSHNTPMIGNHEINRFAPLDIWILKDDAKPELRRWAVHGDFVEFEGSHAGYERLTPSVRPVRRIVLDPLAHRLLIRDRFETSVDARFAVAIPMHLAEGVTVSAPSDRSVILTAGAARFRLTFEGMPSWRLAIDDGRIAPSYGIARKIVRLSWHATVGRDSHLTVTITPAAQDENHVSEWARRRSEGPQ
jgi:uncharacterized heparinase superfamily protein